MPEIKHFPRTRVAYVSEVGPLGEAIQRGFDRLFAWIGAHDIRPQGPSIGIFYDDPAKVPAEKLRSDLCVPVADDVQGSVDIQIKNIGDMTVAATIYQGEQNISPAYNEVYDWLRAQGYRDSGAALETYLSQPGEALRAEIAVPIVKAAAPATPKKRAAVPQLKKPTKRAAAKPTKKKAAKRAKKK
ncbi:MAG: GyrI-like domain-containing protein [Chloroflexi bacterium]|nr:GyrI-like domain-containing protein [Chloroflexota bacterium]